jgi:hypothetical protein
MEQLKALMMRYYDGKMKTYEELDLLISKLNEKIKEQETTIDLLNQTINKTWDDAIEEAIEATYGCSDVKETRMEIRMLYKEMSRRTL